MIKFRNFFINETIAKVTNDISLKAEILDILEKLKTKKAQKGNLVWDNAGTAKITRFKFFEKELSTIEKELKKSEAKFEAGKFFNSRNCLQYAFSDGSFIQLVPSGGQVGSSGNSGHEFEREYKEALIKYFETPVKDRKNLKVPFKSSLDQLDTIINTTYKGARVVEVKGVGELNQKREIGFTSAGLKVSGDLNIGGTVTDITLTLSNNQHIYLSLKVGDAKFLNKGIKSIVPEEEIKSGFIENKLGQAFLKQLGINNKWFCESFNAAAGEGVYGDTDIPRTADFSGDVSSVKSLVEAAIGYGYIIIKRKSKSSDEVLLTDLTNKQALMHEVANFRVHEVMYPASGSGTKTVSLKCETKHYNLTFVIRNRGKGVYPNSVDLNYRAKTTKH